jgi:hypothetical protein
MAKFLGLTFSHCTNSARNYVSVSDGEPGLFSASNRNVLIPTAWCHRKRQLSRIGPIKNRGRRSLSCAAVNPEPGGLLVCRGSPSSRCAWSLPLMHLLHGQRRTEWRSFPSIGASPKRCNQPELKSAEFCSSRYKTTCRAQRSFYPRQRGPGFLRAPSLVTMNIGISLPGATPERTNDLYSTVLEPVRGLPGVQAAGAVDTFARFGKDQQSRLAEY